MARPLAKAEAPAKLQRNMQAGVRLTTDTLLELAALRLNDRDLGPQAYLGNADPLCEIFEASAEWVSILDPSGRVLFINRTGRRLLEPDGLSCVPGANWADIWRSEARREASKAMRAASTGGSARFIARRLAADGEASWWDVGLSRVARADGLPSRLFAIARDVTEQKRTEERLRWAANHDPLTSLPNRTLFQLQLEDEIATAELSGGSFALLLLDLDDFKLVNDALGHDAGDALLCELACRLQSGTRRDDFVARLGGDEFAIILAGVENDRQLKHATSAILKRLKEPCVQEGRMLDCHASIGASIFPQHGATRLELMKNADTALYSAKEAGGGTLRIFAPEMRSELQIKHSMLSLAKNALAQQRLVPCYQPKVDLRTGQLHGFEALLRWQHPTMGMQTPDTIQAAFEDDRLARAISDRMIELVVCDMRRWIDMGLDFGHVAINASAAEFRCGNFAERLLNQLGSAGVAPRHLQIEVTETVFLGRGAECVERALKTMQAAGIQVALDDFGTGFASLSHLKQFPVSTIKIDKSFVRDLHEDPDDEAIVRAVISLGQSLNIKVVAEGIETPAQSAYLRKYHCDYGQGFLFGAAETAGAVPTIVKRLTRRPSSGGDRMNPARRVEVERTAGRPSSESACSAGSPVDGVGSKLVPTRNIFIVDDDPEILESSRFLLETMGYRCLTFGSGSAFLSALLDLEPGCLLLDVRMDGLNGHQVLSELRWMKMDWPVVVMSGHSDEARIPGARAAGAQYFLHKPFDEAVLGNILNVAFENLRGAETDPPGHAPTFSPPLARALAPLS